MLEYLKIQYNDKINLYISINYIRIQYFDYENLREVKYIMII